MFLGAVATTAVAGIAVTQSDALRSYAASAADSVIAVVSAPFTVTEDTSSSRVASSTRSLTNGALTLSFPASDQESGGFEVRLSGANVATVEAERPVEVFVCSAAQCPSDGSGDQAVEQIPVTRTTYTSVSVPDTDGTITASVTVRGAGGTSFQVEDRFSAVGSGASAAFRLRRRVTAAARQGADRGFSSRFRMRFAAGSTERNHIFAPAIWYDDNADVSPTWFGGTKSKSSIYWRETRGGLPMVMMQDRATGTALTMAHYETPVTKIDDSTTRWAVASDIRHGAFGVQNATQSTSAPTTIGFVYPANETVLDARSDVSWNRRSNLITDGYYQEYTLLLALRPGAPGNTASTFNAAMADSWRTAYAQIAPAEGAYRWVSQYDIYEAGIGLVNNWSRLRTGRGASAQGVPGEVADLQRGLSEAELQGNGFAYVMGYIGAQLPLGFQLYWYGKTQDMRDKGARTIDFWADNALRQVGNPANPSRSGARTANSGLPFTWYWVGEAKFENSPCEFPIFLRYLGDGMEAVVSAAAYARQLNQPRNNWERFTRRFGDWLLASENRNASGNLEGSWFRAYHPDGSRYVGEAGKACDNNALIGDPKQNTTHIIRFLAQLAAATGESKYLDAAKRAGDYAIANSFAKGRYVGGTTDTANITDREAGIIALRASLALYDVTRDTKWLGWARQAANYSETWVYAYNFKLNNPPVFQQNGAMGMSMISTGQPGADVSASLLTYDLFRLYLFDTAQDDHYLQMAKLIESASKWTTQLSDVPEQRFGFQRDGLLGEAGEFYDQQGKTKEQTGPAYKWLPWLTSVELDPIQRMQAKFGKMSIREAMGQPITNLRAANDARLPGPYANWGL